MFFFFFKQKTAYEMRISDWSSDVCSSDLRHAGIRQADAVDVGRQAGDQFVSVAGHQRRTDEDVMNVGVFEDVAERGLALARIQADRDEIGRASCRERVCQYV